MITLLSTVYDVVIAVVVAVVVGQALIQFLSLEAPISWIVAFAVGVFTGRVFFTLRRIR